MLHDERPHSGAQGTTEAKRKQRKSRSLVYCRVANLKLPKKRRAKKHCHGFLERKVRKDRVRTEAQRDRRARIRRDWEEKEDELMDG